jgi:membrane-associated protease RseP (regulator of RpoE activity)
MSAPKHLWSGDWQAESAAARHRARPRPEEPQPEPPQPPPEPSLWERGVAAMRALRARAAAAIAVFRMPGAPSRTLVVVLAALVVIAGAAYGLSRALTSGDSQRASVNRNIPYLGVQMESVPVNRVLVAGVVPGSPASQAGIGPGDVIVAIDNHPVSQPGDVTGDLSSLHPGDSVQIEIDRGGIPLNTRATLTHEPGP